MADILLLTPPFTQLNTPYPATAYLKGFLNTKNISSYQMDLGIEVMLALFTRESLELLFEAAYEHERLETSNTQRMYALRHAYLRTIEPVIAFLQGHQPTLARHICSDNYLPQASRFEQLDDMEWAFGNMGMQDKAKHFATLYLEDLSDFMVECIDEHFGFSRYAERLGRSANSFEELYNELEEELSYVDQLTIDILDERIAKVQPKLVCISVPFPGNLFSAFRCAQYIKTHYPEIKTAMGGGFPNTELRSLKEPRVFEFFDYITLDDGELPIELLANNVLLPAYKNPDFQLFKRTFLLDEKGEVLYNNFSLRQDYKQSAVGTPDYSDLLLDQYISVIEIANPMHSLWSDGRWNKLTMAHGCYWGKCTFCDISLDYIKLYEPVAARLLVDRMEELIAQTGESGFHFVDEAAPPALMRAVALEIIRRGLTVTWWTNIRFEKSFTRDLCRLLAASGCIAVSGGLEVASDRLLDLIQKGVTVAQVARVTRYFTESGIMVHAYLMYGYPTQTVQETVDSLEMVRQLFEVGVLQSGFWHQFALTAHSPVGLEPEAYGVMPHLADITFANNDIQFTDKTGINHDQFSFGLKKSLFNYMHGIGFEFELQEWFDFPVPNTTIAEDYIVRSLEDAPYPITKPSAKIVWLGSTPSVSATGKSKKGKALVELTFHDQRDTVSVNLPEPQSEWLLAMLEKAAPQQEKPLVFNQLKADYLLHFDHFDAFWYSDEMEVVREIGLVAV
ncbi:B12-binding domain-containing radical SAM protein [Lewinella cohaerens]|uniref:B12-binding domain-containing radical SAM protein n=1 Tax=Lewinella cohaerens TaxID=70995 RepID=UPI000361A171|nr:B12-binding domain-containing radical SAM protein [Lewinella cohaerens]